MNPLPSNEADYEAAISALQPGWLTGNGRFTLIERLGAGDNGVVWLADDEQLHERVALKFLAPSVALNAAALTALRRETARARRLAHPNIARVHDLFSAGHEAFIAMEYVDGADVGRLRLNQPYEVYAWNNFIPLLDQLCDALQYLHAEGFAHGDLKPANLLVDRKGRLKLTDFGFASLGLDSTGEAVTPGAEGSAEGASVAHRSPAQLSGALPTVADDIYALGATLYEMLTGQPPFHEGDVPNQVRHRLPPPLSERLAERAIQNEIPALVGATIMACLAKDPAQRPASVKAVIEGWQPPEPAPCETATSSEDGAPKEVSVTPQPERGSSTIPAVPETPPPLLPDAPCVAESPHRWLVAGILALVVVMCVAAAGVFAWKRWHHDRTAQSLDEGTGTNDSMAAVDAAQVREPPDGATTDQPRPPTAPPAVVTHETAEFVVSGTGFTIKDFTEGARAVANRNYSWRQVPQKFRGWSFTQVSGGRQARIRVHAKRDATLYAATAPSQPGVDLTGWYSELVVFHYNDAKRTRMSVISKRLQAGEELEVPQGNWSGVILLLPK